MYAEPVRLRDPPLTAIRLVSQRAAGRPGRERRPAESQRRVAPPPAAPLIEAKSFNTAQQRANNPNEPRVDPTAVHARNFLDCVKSRQQPVCHIGIGFNSSLPCILGVQAIREGRTFAWDDKTRTAKPV